MQLSSAPAKLTEAWAAGGNKNTIPVPSQIFVTPGAASWTDGFPPLTMTPVASGGVPPSGLDMNGALNAMSATDIWYCAGAGFPWDSAFSTAIGGYPQGSRVLTAAGTGYWLCTVDNNTTNPDAGGAGWALQGVNVVSSVYASAQQTVTPGSFPGQAKVLFDTVEFDAGLWNSANKRFVAPYAGKYRITGSVLLVTPNGQNLATLIYKNGSIVRQCVEFPQVSNVNLSLPFEGIINCAVGDYLEIYLYATGSAVTVGQAGSNQVFVFAQCSYMGT